MAATFAEIGAYKLSGVQVKDKELGHGSYATVLELDYMGIKCAGKRIHHLLLRDEEITIITQRFAEECHLLSQIRHPNIVQFLGVYFQQDEIAPILVMEFLYCNLTTCIEKYGILPDEITYSILHDVAVGINYLHHQVPPIIHRDLSSNNILLTPNMTAKISDLGVAKILNLSQNLASRMTQNPGTLAFMPPEVLVAQPKYDTSIDVFSYGILIIHMLSCRWPEPQLPQVKYEGDKLIPLTEAERRGELLQTIGLDHPLMELIHRCIHNDAKQRACSNEMVKKLELLVSQFPPTFANRLEIYQHIDSIKLQDKNDAVRVDDHLTIKVQELQDEIIKCNDEFQMIDLAHAAKVKELQDHIKDLDEQKKTISDNHSKTLEQLKVQKELLVQAIQSLQSIEKDIQHTHEEELTVSTNVNRMEAEQVKHELKQTEKEKVQTVECQMSTSSEQSGKTIEAIEESIQGQQAAGIQEFHHEISSKVKPEKSFHTKRSREFDLVSSMTKSTSTSGGLDSLIKEEESQSNLKRKWAATLGRAKGLLTSTSKQQSRPEVSIVIDTTSTVALSGELPLGSPINASPKPLVSPISVPVKPIKQIHDQKLRKNGALYVGKYDYTAFKDDELSFKKGDLMKIISTDGDWWYASLIGSQKKGYVPSNYVAENTSLEAEEWFLGQLDQSEAEKLLMSQENKSGSYLVCENATKLGSYTLYVRNNDKIIMYPIRYLEGRGFFVTPLSSLSSVQALVYYYQHKSEGLCSKLIKPCVLPIQYQSIKTSDGREVALVRKVSSDEFSQMWEGVLDKTTATVKLFPHSCVKSIRSKRIHEVQIMKKLDHKNIIRFLAECTGEGFYCIVKEFMQYGSLLNYLHSQSSKQSATEAQLIGMASQIAAGMQYLEEHKYIHRDLAARSVFVGNGSICKIGNFHSAIHTEERGHNFDMTPEIRWTAPEVVEEKHFSTKSDVWSFGILLYEIITLGSIPYPDMTDDEVNEQVTEKHYRMPCPQGCPIELHYIMMQCWKRDYACRPTFETLTWQLEDFYTQKEIYDAGYDIYA